MNRPVRLATGAGLAAFVIVLLLVIRGSASTYEVSATFDQVRGLIEGGEVKAGAQNVGTVEDIRLGEGGLPIVTMRVDNDYRIQQGAFADLRLASNLGAINRYVELTQGDGPELPDGAELGPSMTDEPVDLDLAVSTLDKGTRQDLAELIAGLDRATTGRGDDLRLTLRHSARALGETANVLHQVNRDQLAVRTLVAEGRRAVGALAANHDEVGAMADRLAAVLTIAARRQSELARTAAAFGPGAAGARATLARLAASTANLRALVADARPAVDELLPTARVLLPAVDALRPLIAEVNRLLERAPGQLRRLGGVLDEANPLLRRLDPVLDGMGPLVDHLRARAPEVIGFFTLLADATSNFDVNGNLVRSTAIPIQSARHPNLIGASSDAAGSLVRPFDRTPGAAEGEPWKKYFRSFIGGGKNPRSFIDPDEEGP